MFDAIQSISDEARRALDDPEIPREQLLKALSVSHFLGSLHILGRHTDDIYGIGIHHGEPRVPRAFGCLARDT